MNREGPAGGQLLAEVLGQQQRAGHLRGERGADEVCRQVRVAASGPGGRGRHDVIQPPADPVGERADRGLVRYVDRLEADVRAAIGVRQVLLVAPGHDHVAAGLEHGDRDRAGDAAVATDDQCGGAVKRGHG